MVRTIRGNILSTRARSSAMAAALAACTVLALPAYADVQSGVVKYETGDFSGAIQEWLPLASENDPNALFNLGQVYRLGRGVDKDMDAARNYYERAARLGHVSAQGNLGTLYFFAENSELKDQEKAVSWWQEAATNGDARSQYMLGVLFFNGDVVDRDWTRAYAWMSLAASSGLPEASQAETSMLKHMTAAQVADAREISLTLVNPAGAFPNSMPVQFADKAAPVNPATATPVSAVAPASANADTVSSTVVPIDASAAQAEPAVTEMAEAAPDAPTPPAAMPVEMASADASMPPVDAAPQAPAMEDMADAMSEPVQDAMPASYSYKLQLASFSSEDKANNGWSQYSSKHMTVLGSLAPDIVAADLGDRGTFYRLFANGFETKSDAADACAQLKAEGQGCMVVSAN